MLLARVLGVCESTVVSVRARDCRRGAVPDLAGEDSYGHHAFPQTIARVLQRAYEAFALAHRDRRTASSSERRGPLPTRMAISSLLGRASCEIGLDLDSVPAIRSNAHPCTAGAGFAAPDVASSASLIRHER